MLKNYIKYLFVLFFITEKIVTSQLSIPLEEKKEYIPFLFLRFGIMTLDPVLKHEEAIHAATLCQLSKQTVNNPENSNLIDNEIKRYAKVINLQAKKYPCYRALKKRLKITPSQEEDLYTPFLVNLTMQNFVQPLRISGVRRLRNEDASDNDSIASDETIPYNETE